MKTIKIECETQTTWEQLAVEVIKLHRKRRIAAKMISDNLRRELKRSEKHYERSQELIKVKKEYEKIKKENEEIKAEIIKLKDEKISGHAVINALHDNLKHARGEIEAYQNVIDRLIKR